MIWFTADQHFNHNNIITYCNRPFNSVDHMNNETIKRWNSVVKQADTVYILGDFIFLDQSHYAIELIDNTLNGRKNLLLGDHEKGIKHSQNFKTLEVVDSIIKLKHDPPIILCHWCMRVWPNSHYNSWHLFGHSHGCLKAEGKSYDVGVDNNNFYPVSLDTITEIMKYKPDNFNLVKPKSVSWYEQTSLDFSYPE